jgi:hypothetical protein
VIRFPSLSFSMGAPGCRKKSVNFVRCSDGWLKCSPLIARNVAGCGIGISAATEEHIRFERKLKTAVMMRRVEEISSLMPLADNAADERDNADQAIKQHEDAAHRTFG